MHKQTWRTGITKKRRKNRFKRKEIRDSKLPWMKERWEGFDKVWRKRRFFSSQILRARREREQKRNLKNKNVKGKIYNIYKNPLGIDGLGRKGNWLIDDLIALNVATPIIAINHHLISLYSLCFHLMLFINIL